MVIELDRNTGPTTLHIKYTDALDRQQGPFQLAFDPDAELYRAAKANLELLKKSWVLLRDYDGKTLLYFTQLMTQRHGLEEIRYGLDVKEPDQRYEFSPPDPNEPFSIGDTLPFIEVPTTTKFVTVQLKFRDGSVSTVETFKR